MDMFKWIKKRIYRDYTPTAEHVAVLEDLHKETREKNEYIKDNSNLKQEVLYLKEVAGRGINYKIDTLNFRTLRATRMINNHEMYMLAKEIDIDSMIKAELSEQIVRNVVKEIQIRKLENYRDVDATMYYAQLTIGEEL